jgi:hypothetical protein
MGVRRARRLVLGLSVLAAVPVALLQGTGAAATPGKLVPASGVVGADGKGAVPAGWTVEHPSPGYYVLAGPGHAADLDVDTWDGDAQLAINPEGDGDVAVTFTRDGRGVDTRFTWRALVTRR